jgi:E3 ubiquitin-protein ligase listerin
LLEEEIRQINRSADIMSKKAKILPEEPILEEANKSKKFQIEDDDDESSIKIRGMLSTREIVSTYKMKELNMELIIQLPLNYPLGIVEVSSVRRIGVSEKEWRNWLLQLTTYLTHFNGSIIQGLEIWKQNVDRKFHGVEECTICYNVIHGTNYQFPKMKCRTCRKLFHQICLYKWFESSSKATCPLCRNLF